MLGVGVAAVVVSAAPAAAVITEGNCRGSATLRPDDPSDTVVLDAAETRRVTVPREADVEPWSGDMGIPPPDEEVAHRGSITLDGPFGTITVRSWSGETKKVVASGSDHYDLDTFLPGGILGGVEMTVGGVEHYGDTVCRGHVDLKVEGSVVNAGSGAAAAGTAATGYGLYRLARGRRP